MARGDFAQGGATGRLCGSRLWRPRRRHGRGRGLLPRKGSKVGRMRTIFLRILEADDKAEALRAAIWAPVAARGKQRFELDAVSFAAVPRSPFAYWVSDRLRSLFGKLQHFESGGRSVLGGLKTLSDERFVRVWWELPIGIEHLWPGLVKGGAFSRFYADVYLRVNWRTKGQEISWYGYQRRPREGFGAASRGVEAYFRPGLTWP